LPGFHFLTNAVDVTPTETATTFGETKDAQYGFGLKYYIFYTPWTPPKTFKAEVIRFFATAEGVYTRLAIYHGATRTLVAESEGTTVKRAGWNVAKLKSPALLWAGVEYFIAIWQGDVLGFVFVTSPGKSFHWVFMGTAPDTFPSTLPKDTGSMLDRAFCGHVIGGWQKIDVSDYIPTGATGVILDIHNTSFDTSYKIDIRKTGSTDFDYATFYDVYGLYQRCHYYAMIGVDEARTFEAIIENTALRIWLVGWTDDAVVFFTNYVEKQPTAELTWHDIDVSANVPAGATCVIVKLVIRYLHPYVFDARKNGSTDDFATKSYIFGNSHIFVLVGLDEARIFEIYVSSTESEFACVVGYTLSPIQFSTNDIVFTPTISDSWTDLDLSAYLHPDAEGAIFRIRNFDPWELEFGELRKNGSTDARQGSAYYRLDGHVGGFVGVDANKICEYCVSDKAYVKLHLVGPIAVVPPPPPKAGILVQII